MDVVAPANLRSNWVFQTLVIWLLFASVAIWQTYDVPLVELLTGTDDDIRILRVRAFLDGVGWYDDRLTRIAPPEGAELHWSRLPDLPIAGMILALGPLIGEDAATRAAAIGVPVLLGLGFLMALTWAVRPVIGGRYAAAAALAGVTLTAFQNFWPGRVDHHGWMMIACALALGALLRTAARAPATRGAHWGAGAAVAVGLAATAETSLVFALAMAVLFGLWVSRGEPAAADARRFALACALAALVLFPVAHPPTEWARVACDAFSLPYLAGVGAGVLFWYAAPWAAGTRAGVPRRLAAGTIGAAALAGTLLLVFPACRHGPLSQVPPDQWRLWLSHAGGQASALSKGWPANVLVFAPIALGGIGLLERARLRGETAIAAVLGGVLLVTGALTVESARASWAAHPAAALALALTLVLGWDVATQRWSGWRRAVAANLMTLVVLIAPLAIGGAAKALQPDPAKPCAAGALRDALAAMNRPPGLVAAPIFRGPDILIASRHSVLGAPYHRNVAGNRAAAGILRADSADAAQDKMAQHAVEYVLVCRAKTEFYQSPFYDRLAAGNPPAWLEPLVVSADHAYRIYAVATKTTR